MKSNSIPEHSVVVHYWITWEKGRAYPGEQHAKRADLKAQEMQEKASVAKHIKSIISTTL